jgi:antitoxin MazE
MFTRLDERGAVAIPEELREGLNEDSILEIVRRDDGVIELRPQDVDATQLWFWSERWQKMEQEADADLAAGRIATFDNLEDFLAALEDERDE